MCLPLVNTMLSNVSHKKRQGLVTGTAQSLGAALRSLGPIISGGVFSLSVSMKFPYLCFWFLCVIYFICFLVIQFMSPEEKLRIIEQKALPLQEELDVSETESLTAPDANGEVDNGAETGESDGDDIEMKEHKQKHSAETNREAVG